MLFCSCSFLWVASASSVYSKKMIQSRRCQQLEQKEARSCKNLFSKRMGKQKSLFIFLIITTTLSLSDVNCENGDLQNTGNKWKCFYCLYSCQEYILDFGTVWISIEGRKHVCWEEHIPSPSLLMLNATVQTADLYAFLSSAETEAVPKQGITKAKYLSSPCRLQ